jgi:hypothetical protein
MSSLLARFLRPFTQTTSTMSVPAAPVAIPEGAERATVAAGCFWGVEHLYRKHFGGSGDNKGLYDARVGYIGGDASNPSYRAVCSGGTGRMCFSPSSSSPSIYKIPIPKLAHILCFYSSQFPISINSPIPQIPNSNLPFHCRKKKNLQRKVGVTDTGNNQTPKQPS